MSVRPDQLENPERDLSLRTREGARQRQREEPANEPKESAAAVELKAFRERLAAARELKDTEQRHCRDCFQRGRDAVLRFLEGT